MRVNFVLIFGVLLCGLQARVGIDVSIFANLVSVDTWKCLRNQGFEFLILQIFNGGIGINSHFAQNVKNARAAGFGDISAYVFSCNNCRGNNPPSLPINRVAQYLKENRISLTGNKLWLDYEPCKNCWLDANSNYNFIASQGKYTKEIMGFSPGIYTSKYSLEDVIGKRNIPELNSYPLWYAHYDKQPNFNDREFGTFAGWRQPYMKQYIGDTIRCGIDVDINWLP